ncbi:3-keto-disaccharide hydrolase [Planctomicrobium sp. SH664]|uniref:3-keto-disaccharide hydrolase n=1 Tax=Planctomicrobium sp. SH664 TaxID=3448125 RepID=UPI003F5CB16F
MKLKSFALIGALLCTPAVHAADNSPPPGFRSLFNGKDFTGWYGMEGNPKSLSLSEEELAPKKAKWAEEVQKIWRVEDGVLVNEGVGAYLTTNDSFSDFELLVDYKTVPLADSGIYLKWSPQVQIWDYTKEGGRADLGALLGSGGLWNNSKGAPGKDPLVLADKPFGEWNTFRIIQLGQRTSIWLNDKLVVDHALMENYWNRGTPLPYKGQIQLQTHAPNKPKPGMAAPPSTPVYWKNIYVREIPADEANALLTKWSGEGFTSLFNGKDLKGWTGATDSCEVVDGVIRWLPKKSGVLHTEKEYSDFKARLEFKLPPAGNNGLAIRYPGEGNTSYTGMCELQILDTEHEKYATIDPRQAHGSVYGMIPAVRGYLRPTGEWNFQEVTVQGPRIIVELNGSVILDGDVSKVTEFMKDTPHPGKDRTQGYFGFAGHSDPVEFRQIAIKELSPADAAPAVEAKPMKKEKPAKAEKAAKGEKAETSEKKPKGEKAPKAAK